MSTAQCEPVELNCVLAVCHGGGIGVRGGLPWPRLRGDMERFYNLTTSAPPGCQNLVIMGRRTWESLPPKRRPLSGRINVVLSRTLKEPPPGADVLARSLDDALRLAAEFPFERKPGNIWIIGGVALYREALSRPGTVRVFLTRILHSFPCDVQLPRDSLGAYQRIEPLPGEAPNVRLESGIAYVFETYIKERGSVNAPSAAERPLEEC
ncbi:ORF2 [Retroperitoneal fibromatosis-associated herpesvirus]|uniref:dihydrofolate reductase n=1 Tax=Retroperitoneal fibromatosis-associated herpesvirus TaxID=111469 RepID=U5NIT4_9GAMA|nr:ORF2 [Retroperitoneal fibromatosis-associated herpesvirus]AGY30691.1 ORF2 [Retroperitoneal fibromatosis-associated herpesvirus]